MWRTNPPPPCSPGCDRLLKQLHLIARYITGRDIHTEPTLYLWGLKQTDDLFPPWDLLIAARERFEVGKISQDRPFSEPDGALVIPGNVLIIVESKFTSPNTFITDGPRKTAQSLTKDEVLTIYQDETNHIIDPAKARATPVLMAQLYRYAILGQFMASLAGPGTEFYLCNLTRAFHENQSFEAFARLVRPEYQHRVCHLRWEDLFILAGLAGGRLRRLQEYLLKKTANLKPAFTFGYW